MLFVKKGFPEPSETPMSEAVLLFAERPGVLWPTERRGQDGRSLHFVGTMAYRGLGCRDGVRRLHDDLADDRVEDSELVGSYCILFFDGSRVRLQTDVAGLCHIFSNRPGTIISNSLQAVLVADGERHSLNRDALLEQLLTGSVTGPETLFDDIVLLTLEKQKSFVSPVAEFRVADAGTRAEDVCHTDFSECLQQQLAVLRGYFKRISALASETAVGLGVSGGYDSRLLLLLAKEAGFPLHAYTYDSEAHGCEQAIAAELARYLGVGLTQVPVRTWRQLDRRELSANMMDSLYTWDGRTNATMGTFNDVHTVATLRVAMGPARLNLNGLGGELYRNPEHLRASRLDFGHWLRFFVLKPDCAAAIPNKNEAEELIARLGRKYAQLMGIGSLRRFSRDLARRWYRCVWLPFSAGPKLCAENQFAFALMPFADWSASGAALMTSPYLGTGGEFEAAMIRALDRGAAGVTSNYGYDFERVPLRARVADGMRAIAPLGLRLRSRIRRASLSVGRTCPAGNLKLPQDVQKGLQILKETDLPVNWDVLLSTSVNRDRCYYIAYFLNSFQEHLRASSAVTWV